MKLKMKAALVTLLVMIGLVGFAAPASATVYHGCPSGVGCMWYDKDGQGLVLVLAVGTYGYNQCWNLPAVDDNKDSSASADYGGGWDLKMYYYPDCDSAWPNDFGLSSSHFANFTGNNSYFNDKASSIKITQL